MKLMLDRGLLHGEELEFAKATRLTRIKVSDDVRNESTVPRILHEERVEVIKGFMQSDEQNAKGPQQIEWQQSRIVSVQRGETIEVKIPGEYARTEFKPSNLVLFSSINADNPKVIQSVEDPQTLSESELQRRLELCRDIYPQVYWNHYRASRSTVKPWRPMRKLPVYYATNRNVEKRSSTKANRFGNKVSGELSYGTVLVNIPSESYHKRGQLELPGRNIFGWQKVGESDKHFFIETLNSLSESLFLKSAVGEDDILLFVHGYNNSFKDAALRFAQVHHDLQFPGKPVFFSWPSAGGLDNYGDDEQAAAASSAAFAKVITTLLKGISESSNPDAKIHLIAHSMGNRVVLKGLYQLDQSTPEGQQLLGHVVLAAPDVGARKFAEYFPAMGSRSMTVSMYSNPNDLALKASRVKHVESRAGEGPFFLDLLNNIDSRKADTSILGHGYFSSEDLLLVDLQLLFNYDMCPIRPTIREKLTHLQQIYWAFP